MTATPLADLLAAVASLNDPNQPFTFTVEDGKVVGRWDIVKATSLYPSEVTHVDKDYRIEVELDPDEHTYDYEDHTDETHATLDGDGLHVEKNFFKGRTKSKEFSFELGGVSKTDDGVSMKPVVYSFDTDRIKQPLFEFLEQHGYGPKKGFFRRLFS